MLVWYFESKLMKSFLSFVILMLAPLSQMIGKVESFGILDLILAGACMTIFIDSKAAGEVLEVNILTWVMIFSAAAICLVVGLEDKFPCLECQGLTR